MREHGTLAKTIAISGTVLVALPVLAPLAFGLVSLVGDRGLLIDWLMPAELFPVVAVGSLLLLTAAWMGDLHRSWFVSGIVAMLVTLFGGQMIAEATGLADGSRAATGWPWVLVTAMIGLYALLVVAMAVAGGILTRDLFHHRADDQPPPAVPAM